MAKVSQMQNVPSHLTTLRSNDHVRRHISHCIYSAYSGQRKYKCSCQESPYNNLECHSSSKCDYYKETE